MTYTLIWHLLMSMILSGVYLKSFCKGFFVSFILFCNIAIPSCTMSCIYIMRIKNDLELQIGSYQSRATCFDIILTEALAEVWMAKHVARDWYLPIWNERSNWCVTWLCLSYPNYVVCLKNLYELCNATATTARRSFDVAGKIAFFLWRHSQRRN